MPPRENKGIPSLGIGSHNGVPVLTVAGRCGLKARGAYFATGDAGSIPGVGSTS